jgi:hypothetical protein
MRTTGNMAPRRLERFGMRVISVDVGILWAVHEENGGGALRGLDAIRRD